MANPLGHLAFPEWPSRYAGGATALARTRTGRSTERRAALREQACGDTFSGVARQLDNGVEIAILVVDSAAAVANPILNSNSRVRSAIP
jgi:hypothetical protein